MKLVQFIKNDHPYLGILTPKGIVDVDAEAEVVVKIEGIVTLKNTFC